MTTFQMAEPITINKYIYDSNRAPQYAVIENGRQRFISAFLARSWESTGKAIIMEIKVPHCRAPEALMTSQPAN